MPWELRSKILCGLLVVIVAIALAILSLLVVTVVDPQRTFWGQKHDCDINSSIFGLLKTEEEALKRVGIDPSCGSHIYYPNGEKGKVFKRWNCTFTRNDTYEIAPWTKYVPKTREKRATYNFHLCPTDYFIMRPFGGGTFSRSPNLYVVEVDWGRQRRYQWVEMGRCSDSLCTPTQCISEVRSHGVLVSTIEIRSQYDLVQATKGELLRFENYYVEGCCKCKSTFNG